MDQRGQRFSSKGRTCQNPDRRFSPNGISKPKLV